MLVTFTKMHGLGNDFMVIDGVTQRIRLTAEQISQLAQRHTGVGFDQLLLVEPPRHPDMDFRYRIFNADGSEVENCGNGARCLARFVRDQQLTRKRTLRLETEGGPLTLTVTPHQHVRVDMGRPSFTPASLPFIADETHQLTYPLLLPSDIAGREPIEVSIVSMGNPHAVVLVDDVKHAPVETLGPVLEAHERFPRRVNVGFMQIKARNRIDLRVYERGSGETRACGTGACAAVAAGIRRGLLDARTKVHLPGGMLTVDWSGQPDHSLFMTGPATTVFEGRIELE